MLRLLQALALASVVVFAAASASAEPETPSPPPPAENPVSAVTVVGERPQTQTSVDRRSYSLAKDVTAQTGSVADVLRNLPSVSVDAQGNPSLLGQGNVTILIDGRPSSQFSGGSVGQALQAMPADRIERIEVMTNPPAEFRADGAGGIINLVMKKANGAGRSGSVRVRAGSHDRTLAAVTLGYTSSKASLSGDLTMRRTPQAELDIQELSRIDPATGLFLGGLDVERSRWTNDYAQAHAGLDYDLDSRTRLTGSVRYSANRYHTQYADRFIEANAQGDPVSAQDRTADEDDDIDRGETALTWRRTLGEGHSLALHADHQTYHGRYRRLDQLTPVLPAGAAPSSQGVFWNDASPRTTLTTDYERPLAGGALKLGYDFEYAPKRTDQNAGEGPAGGPLSPDPSRQGVFYDTETINEAYVSYERGLGALTLLAGLRAKDLRLAVRQDPDLRVTHDYPRLYPNLRLAWRMDDGRQLTANFSRRTNVPYSEQLNPLPLSQSPLHLDAGNPDLRPEDAFSYELGYEDRRDGRLTIATLFYRETRDAFSIVTTRLPNATILQTTVNAGAIRRAGGEWAVSGKLTPRLGYNLSLDAYWTQISAENLGLAQPRSTVTGFGRGSLNWQVTPKDLVQLNLFTTGKVLRPQGYSAPTYSGNIGYRHTLTPNAAWMLLVEDPFRTLQYRSVELIDGVENRRLMRQASQAISLALVWTLAGKPKDAGFDFGGGAGR